MIGPALNCLNFQLHASARSLAVSESEAAKASASLSERFREANVVSYILGN